MKKKIFALLLGAVCLLSVSTKVLAYNETVVISDVDATTEKVSVSGKTDALAVMIQIRDKDDNIVVMESAGTLDGKFETTLFENFTLECEGKYKVYVADYEGGSWATHDFVVEHEYGIYTYNNDATCEKDGTMTATCSVCNKKDTVADPTHKAIGHKDVDKDGKCDACGKILSASTEDTTATTESKDAKPTPKTGDNTPIMVVGGLMMLSTMGLVVLKSKSKVRK